MVKRSDNHTTGVPREEREREGSQIRDTAKRDHKRGQHQDKELIVPGGINTKKNTPMPNVVKPKTKWHIKRKTNQKTRE